MLGCIGPWQEALEPGEGCWLSWAGGLLPGSGGGQPWLPSGVWCTLNKRIRTGTDKGNLTV